MATFEEREKAHEAKWAQDQETTFKIGVRRNKLLGLWAAELMGVSGAAAETYAKEVVESDFREPGEEDVFEKVMADLKDKGVDVSEHRVRKEMSDLLERASERADLGRLRPRRMGRSGLAEHAREDRIDLLEVAPGFEQARQLLGR